MAVESAAEVSLPGKLRGRFPILEHQVYLNACSQGRSDCEENVDGVFGILERVSESDCGYDARE